MEQQPSSQAPLLRWEAHIHPHHKRGVAWFLSAAALGLIMLGYSVYTRAWSFSIVIILSAAVYWLMHRRTPQQREIALYDWGFVLDDRPVGWENCTGFWFLDGPGYHELHIEHNRKVVGDFVIQTGDSSPEEISDVLKTYLPELEDRRECILDTIARICKI